MNEPTQQAPVSRAVRERLHRLWERTGDAALLQLAEGGVPFADAAMANDEQRSNMVSTCLMRAFRDTGDAEVFALLYELNHDRFLRQVQGHLSHKRACVDPNDVVQESFLNIYRYPHRFFVDRADAFHGWAHRIVRNTTINLAKAAARQPIQLVLDDQLGEPEDRLARAPLRAAADRETAAVVNCGYVLFLAIYLEQFQRLSARERTILTLAEIERRRYREIGAQVGATVVNVKMMVFRARRRILRGMAESLASMARIGLAADPRPA
ncbi:MAG TPA: RNA polymerase sigma factor [Planctomycetota bacterium]|nr:RNA polymerase sigma factor [Planctomycetota bacterium]